MITELLQALGGAAAAATYLQQFGEIG